MTRARLVLAAMLATAVAAFAADAPRSDDATSQHSFSDVPYWSSVFDDPGRDEWQRPAALLEALGLRPGMVVADLGAGTGYLSRRLATAVGPEGTVLAVETEPNLVVHLRERAERERTPNVVPILASPDNPRLPRGAVDVLVVLDTYHHLDHRRAYLPALRRCLAPGGRIVVIDWQKRETPVGPPLEHRLARAQVVDEMQASGYVLVADLDVLPYQYLLTFAPK